LHHFKICDVSVVVNAETVFWVIWHRQSDVNDWSMLCAYGGIMFFWNTVTHVPTRCCGV